MPGLTSGLYIGLSGLQAAQKALSVVGHNITNVNTDSYSRQQVTLTSNQSQVFGTLEFGTGVSISNIMGVRNKYLELQITQTTSKQVGANTCYTNLEAISAIFEDDGSTGLSSLLQNYFEAFQELAANPESGSVRTNVVGQAQSLVTGLKDRYQALEDQRTAADQSVDSIVNEVNTLTAQIADLNKQVSSDSSGSNSSDARDQRQALVNQLAGLVGVQVYEDANSNLQITLDCGAAVLVSGGKAYTMSATPDGSLENHYCVEVDMGGATSVDVTSQISGGSLGANLNLRDKILSGYEQQLDELAAGIVSQTNLLHRTGYALDGTTTGLDIFQGTSANGTDGLPTTVSAANNYKGMVNAITVNASIVASPSLIAAADAANSSGNNKIANAIASLQDATGTVDTDGDGVGDFGPFSSVISALVSTIGTDVQSYETASTTQENLLSALKTQRDSVSGVDLDEEAVKLLTYQRAYQASARFISVMDQLTEELISQLAT